MRARPLSVGALVALALGIAQGCSALVDAELTRVNCSWEGAVGPPACPVGQACRAGVCSPCAKNEICGDNLDNDCNGQPDDGCNDGGLGGGGGIGGDASGGTSGFGGDTGGAPGGGAAGAGGSTGGSAGSGGSSGSGGASGGTGGTGGTVAGSLGTTCTKTSDCNAGLFCEDPAVFGAVSGPKLCTRGCCKSEDCGTGSSVCFPSTGGGSACVPAASAGRGDLGAKAAGDLCTKPSDCRSGLCQGGKCFDTCCSDGNCSGSQYCVKSVLPGTARYVMACGTNPGNGGYQATCSTDSQCQSGICSSSLYCSKSCCTAKDCAGSLNLVCLHTSGLKRCAFPGFVPGTKLMGVTCGDNSECKSGHCLGPTGGPYYCSDTCCSDFDCGAGFACRAASVGGTNQLLCVKL